MSIVPFPEKIRAPGQEITKALVELDLVTFFCEGEILFSAPFTCILNLIQRIWKGLPVECRESQGTFANYVGAVMKKDQTYGRLVVRLRYKAGEHVKLEDISIGSLLEIW